MINSVVLMGRLTKEPELKSTQSGVSVLRITLAVERAYTPAGQEKKTDFIDCIAWRQTAEFISRYFHRGSMLAVQGEIQTGSYTDRDGNKRNFVEVAINQASFCGSKENNQVNAESGLNQATQSETDIEEIDVEDDLPF